MSTLLWLVSIFETIIGTAVLMGRLFFCFEDGSDSQTHYIWSVGDKYRALRRRLLFDRPYNDDNESVHVCRFVRDRVKVLFFIILSTIDSGRKGTSSLLFCYDIYPFLFSLSFIFYFFFNSLFLPTQSLWRWSGSTGQWLWRAEMVTRQLFYFSFYFACWIMYSKYEAHWRDWEHVL